MAKKLYIGGLSYDLTDDDLREAFAACGNVESATVIKDKFSGRSKGFGFVEMSTEEEAQNAIATMNGQELAGRQIIVNEARPMEDRPHRDFNSRGGNSGGGYQRDFRR